MNANETVTDRERGLRAMMRLAERRLRKIERSREMEYIFGRAMGVPSECYALPGYVKWERDLQKEEDRMSAMYETAALALETLCGTEILERCSKHGLDVEHCYPDDEGCDEYGKSWTEFYGIGDDDEY